jgi:hypothetical protein
VVIGSDRCRAGLERFAKGLCAFDDELRVAVPARFAGGDQMVEAGEHLTVGARLHGANRVCGDVGQEFGAGRGADLVGDDFQLVALFRQTQHGLGEVGAARGVDPAGAEDEVARAAGDGLFAFELGLAIDAERAGGVGLFPRRRAAAVEDVVGRVVDEPGAELLGFVGEDAGGERVDRAHEFGFGLGLVDGGVRGGVDDDVGLHLADGFGESGEVGEVTAVVGAVEFEGDEFAEGARLRCSSQPTWPPLPRRRIFIGGSSFSSTVQAPYCLATQSR